MGEPLTVPVELLVFALSVYLGSFTIAIHVLLRIYNTVSEIDKRDAVRAESFKSVARHTERNKHELERIEKFFQRENKLT